MIPTEIAICTWIGAVLLALCGLPQAIDAATDPNSTRGLSWLFLASWWLGELFMFAGMLPIASWHALANYAFNVILISYLIGMKWVYGR